MQISNIFLSVILPTYNRKHCVYRMIDSVLMQSFRDFELIIIDDGSTDNTFEMVKNLYDDDRIRIIRKENGGVSSARNLGISLAKGEYITFVDSDDYLLDGFFENIHYILSSYPEDVLVYGGYIFREDRVGSVPLFWGDKNYNDGEMTIKKGVDFIKDFCLKGGVSWGCAKIFKRSIVEKYHLFFDENIHYGEDMLFNLQAYMVASNIIANHEKFYVCDLAEQSSLSRGMLDSKQKINDLLLTYECLGDCPELQSFLALNCSRHFRQWISKKVFFDKKLQKRMLEVYRQVDCTLIGLKDERREVILGKKSIFLMLFYRYFYSFSTSIYARIHFAHPFINPILRLIKRFLK